MKGCFSFLKMLKREKFECRVCGKKEKSEFDLEIHYEDHLRDDNDKDYIPGEENLRMRFSRMQRTTH